MTFMIEKLLKKLSDDQFSKVQQAFGLPDDPERQLRQLLARNSVFKDRHAGATCFILGNGYSAGQIDLRLLRGHDVMSVSSGYLHKGYEEMRPLYHCLPQLTYGRLTKSIAVQFFQEMDEMIFAKDVFLSHTEEPLVRENGLFPHRNVHYLQFRDDFDRWLDRDIIAIDRPIPSVATVPIMALMITFYLGYRRVVLLGFDHDVMKTGRYGYPYELKVLKDMDPSVGPNNVNLSSKYDDFHIHAQIWRQYRVLKEIAHKNGITILNAAHPSELDEFQRVTYEEALALRD